MNKKHCLIPGITETFLPEEILFSSRVKDGPELKLILSAATLALWKEKGELWSWEELHALSPDIRVSRDLRELEEALRQRGFLLTQHPGNFFYQERSLSPGGYSPWSGFSRNLVITPDQHRGWWLEVPGAAASLWAESSTELSALVEEENLSPELQEFFARQGFGGVAGLPEVTSFDWIWWDSVRFMDRLGPHARKGDYPLGLIRRSGPLEPERKSVRGHEGHRLITVRELTALAASVFRETGSVDSGWYGEVSRVRGPSGGGAYETELWALVDRCEGLAPGLYRYDGRAEKFVLSPDHGLLETWKERARDSWGKKYGIPQVTLALAADLRKLPKKYLRLALQISLLNAGVRLSELLTAADSLKLSSCALGGGAMRELGQVQGLHPLLYGPLCEVAVGGSAE